MDETLTVSVDADRVAVMTDQEWLAFWTSQGVAIRTTAMVLARLAKSQRRSRAQVARHGKKEGTGG